MMVKVSVPISSYQSISISKQALIVRSELQAVYVLNQKNKPQLRQVRIGKQNQDNVEILSGLLPGDRIALNPNQVLKEINAARANSDV
jgi:multidrug efflux pump subunit AcrA (membrane-fusion protein)